MEQSNSGLGHGMADTRPNNGHYINQHVLKPTQAYITFRLRSRNITHMPFQRLYDLLKLQCEFIDKYQNQVTDIE